MPDYRNLEILPTDHGSEHKLPPELTGNEPGATRRRRKSIELDAERGRAVAPARPGSKSTTAEALDPASRKKTAGTAIGSLCWDSQIDCVYMDDGMAEFLGRLGADSLGTLEDLTRLVHDQDRGSVVKLIRSCMLHGSDFSTRVTLCGARGERPLAWFGTAILTDSGRPSRLLLTGHRPRTATVDRDADTGHGIPPGEIAGDALVRASHEIRSSISAILGFSRLLMDEADLGSGQRHYAETISKNAGQLMQIIDDVFAEARRQVRPSDLPAFRLSELMADLVEMFDAGRRSSAVELTFELSGDDVLIRADQVKIRRILINLLDNALKFTEKGSVRLRGGLQESPLARLGTAVFEVEDTGMGIEPGDLKLIFEPRGQVLSAHAPDSGMGLGLPIGRDLAKQLGGDIQVQSQVGQGTRFRVSIPVGETSPAGHQAVSAGSLASAAPSARRRR